MRKTVLFAVACLAAMAQTTQLDPTQLKRAIRVGTILPAACTTGDLFFKTDAQPGSNLYGCSSANTWSPEAGSSYQNCQWNPTTQVLGCLNSAGSLSTTVMTSAGRTANQWVDYVSTAGVPHTSQPSAAQIQNAVDQTGNYSNPSWISSLAWNKLTGIPSSFNAGQLQGRAVTGTMPTDLQYLGWNNAAAQWEPKTLPIGTVASVFGRSGAVTAQIGDYSAAQVSNAVDQTASYSNPNWLTALAWSKLTGIPSSFNAGQLQGRTLASTAPNSSQYLGWNSSTLQWEPRDLPAVSASQLPGVAMRTDQSNTVSAGTQDFHSAAHTLPMKSGPISNMPGTCSVGEAYFATDAAAGSNLYGCTATNTWRAQGASPYSISSDGVPVSTDGPINFITGLGLLNLITDTGSQTNIQIGLDSAIVQTQSGEQGGTALLCSSSGGSSGNYRCSMNPTLAAYSTGMMVHWRPDVNGSGGATTLNIDNLGAVPVKMPNGTDAPGATTIAAGQMYEVWYDGSAFRLAAAGASGGGGTGNISSVFGRTGAITAQTGDYAASQISGLAQVATSGSYNDLSNRPAIPAAQVNADWNAASGPAQVLNKPAIPSIPGTASLLKGDAAGNAAAAVAGTDYMTPSTPVLAGQLPAPGAASLGGVQSKDCTGVGHVLKIGTDGTVVCSADGGTGGGGTIPATTSVLRGDGAGNAAAATAGTDYAAPGISTTFTASQRFSGGISLGSSYLSTTRTAGSGGVIGNQLCKIDSTGNVVLPARGDTNVLGVCTSTAGSGAGVEVATRGIVNCVADNTTVTGNIATVGTVTVGACADSGTADATTIGNGTQVIGTILTAVNAGALVSIQLYGPGYYGTQLPATINSNTSGRAATATALAATPTKCSAGSYPLGIDAQGNAQSCTAAVQGVTYYFSQPPDTGGNAGLSSANSILVDAFYVSVPVSITAADLDYRLAAADSSTCSGGNYCYSLGIYSAPLAGGTGTLLISTGARSFTSAGLNEYASGASLSLPAGWYLLAFTGSATAAKLSTASGMMLMKPWNRATLATTSSGGALPGTVTIPAASWGFGYTPYIGVRQ